MKNQIIVLDKNCYYKVLGYSEDKIIYSTKRHNSFGSLLSALEKPGFTEGIESILISSIKELSYNDQDNGGVAITYFDTKKKEKTKNITIHIDNDGEREAAVSEIASLKGNLKKTIVNESKVFPLFRSVLLLSFVLGCFWWLRKVAITAQNGGHEVVTIKKNRFIAQQLVNVVESIGPLGVVIIGVLIAIYIIYSAFNRLKNPGNEITYLENNN